MNDFPSAEFQASVKALKTKMVRRGIYPEWVAIEKARLVIKKKYEIKAMNKFNSFFNQDIKRRRTIAERKANI